MPFPDLASAGKARLNDSHSDSGTVVESTWLPLSHTTHHLHRLKMCVVLCFIWRWSSIYQVESQHPPPVSVVLYKYCVTCSTVVSPTRRSSGFRVRTQSLQWGSSCPWVVSTFLLSWSACSTENVFFFLFFFAKRDSRVSSPRLVNSPFHLRRQRLLFCPTHSRVSLSSQLLIIMTTLLILELKSLELCFVVEKSQELLCLWASLSNSSMNQRTSWSSMHLLVLYNDMICSSWLNWMTCSCCGTCHKLCNWSVLKTLCVWQRLWVV